MLIIERIFVVNRLMRLGAAVVAIGLAVGVNVAESDESFGGNNAISERDWDPDAPTTLRNAPKPWPGPRHKPPYDQPPEAAQQDFRDTQVDAARVPARAPNTATVGEDKVNPDQN